MERDPNMKICYDRIVPEDEHHPESRLKKILESRLLEQTGKANLYEASQDLDATGVLDHAYMAIVKMKAWPPGFTLKCRFLEGTQVQRARVMEKAKIWERYANIHIEFVTTHDEQVRIAFMQGQGSWSAVGRDALNEQYFPKNEPTMNFGWLHDNTDDNEYERVVVHEFGHALGCVHEHQSPNEHLKWNVNAVYAQFSGPPNNWTKAQIDNNILRKYSPNGISATIFDRASIMLYQFPAELFLDHVGTPLNTSLSDKDKAFIAQMYGAPVTPPAHAAEAAV